MNSIPGIEGGVHRPVRQRRYAGMHACATINCARDSLALVDEQHEALTSRPLNGADVSAFFVCSGSTSKGEQMARDRQLQDSISFRLSGALGQRLRDEAEQ